MTPAQDTASGQPTETPAPFLILPPHRQPLSSLLTAAGVTMPVCVLYIKGNIWYTLDFFL